MRKYNTVLLPLIAFISVWCAIPLYADSGNAREQYRNYQHLSSDSLLKMGERYLYTDHKPEKALMCFTAVSDRYRPGLSQKETIQCLEGFYGRWQTQFFGYANFTSAIDDLTAAQEIADKAGIEAPKLDYYHGVCELTLGIASGENSSMRKAADFFHKSIAVSFRQKDWRTLHRAFDNLVTASVATRSLDKMGPELKLLDRSADPESWRRTVSRLIYSGAVAQSREDYPKALNDFEKLIRAIPQNTENSRYLASAYLKKARVLKFMERFGDMRLALDTALSLTYRDDLRDVRQGLLASLSQCYELMGDIQTSQDVYGHYLGLRDSLMSARFLVNFEEAGMQRERRRWQHDLERADYNNRLKSWILIFAGVVILTILIFLVVLRRKNRALDERTRVLHRQLQQAAHNPKWLDSPAVVDESVTISDTPNEHPDELIPQEIPSVSGGEGPENGEKEKYLGSSLGDEAKTEIADAIRAIVADNKEIFSPDFSLARLAELTGYPSKSVSQVINETFHCNFWTLVNRARIREAMARFDNPRRYGHFSIEGIAESVGFRSRSSFTVWFKKFTGLSAAEYRKISALREEEPTD